MRMVVSFVLALGCVLTGAFAFCQDAESSPFARWEPAIQKFEAANAENPPQPGQILFTGSSSIVRWDLTKWLPGVAAVNRGFGGSQTADSVHFFDRVVLPHKPRLIVFYAGDNDIARGKSPCQVYEDFRAFAGKVRESLPETRLVYIAIKPSLSRWKQVHHMRAANALIKADCEDDPLLTFLDVDAPMLDAEGRPRAELFVQDGLHLSDEGYKLWSALVLPHLAE